MMSILLLLLATGLVATIVVGPLGLGWLEWRVSESGLLQLYGAHAAELLLVVPAALSAAALWRRGHRLAPALALGAAVYALYVSVQFVLFPDYSLYQGNNERFFPLFLALVILSWMVAARAWGALDPSPAPPPDWLRRAFAGVVLLVSGVIGLAWSGQVIGIVATGALPPEFVEEPTAFMLIRLVDLGVILPLSIATAIGLWRSRPLAIRAAYGVASFLSLELGAVLAMGLVQLWQQDPSASTAFVLALAPLFVALATLAALLLRHYAKQEPGLRAGYGRAARSTVAAVQVIDLPSRRAS